MHIFKFATTLTLSVSVLEGLSEDNGFPKAVATTLNRPKKDLHQGGKLNVLSLISLLLCSRLLERKILSKLN